MFLNDKYQTAITALKFQTLFYVPLQKCNQNSCLKEFSVKNFLEKRELTGTTERRSAVGMISKTCVSRAKSQLVPFLFLTLPDIWNKKNIVSIL